MTRPMLTKERLAHAVGEIRGSMESLSLDISTDAEGWDAAIADAKKRIRKLQTTIAVFEELKAKGEKWPRV